MTPKPAIPSLPPPPDTDIVRAAAAVARRLQESGHEAYFVGGCVRDWLLGLVPHDVDVATSAPIGRVQEIFPNTRAVGEAFGVTLVVENHMAIEVATFRTDGAYLDFRRPSEVSAGTLEEDAARRDFTINALYYDPVAGRIRDFHAGALDLRRRILRAIGHPNKRFDEDALRLLRAVRLAVRYQLEIEGQTRKAIVMKAPNLARVSRERVGSELLRILCGPRPGRAFRLMSDLGLWEHCVPEIEALKGCVQGAEFHPEGDVFTHTSQVLDHLPEDPHPALALAAMLHDIAKPATRTVSESGRIHFYNHQKDGAVMARAICERLRYSNELTNQVAELVENHMQFMQVMEMKPVKLRRFAGRPDFQLHLDLHRADSLGSHGDLEAYEFCLAERRRLMMEHGTGHGEEALPRPLAGGDDLIALGLKPGPLFRELLVELHDAQIEGEIRDREEALEFLRRRAEILSGEPEPAGPAAPEAPTA